MTGPLFVCHANCSRRVLQIRLALLGAGRRLIPASEYLDVCRTVDRHSH